MTFNTRASALFMVAKANVPTSGGFVYPLKVLIGLCEKDSHLEMIGDELWYREQNIQSNVIEGKFQIVRPLPFDPYPTCVKCGHIHLFKGPKTLYVIEQNILRKECLTCSHYWFEHIHPQPTRKGK